MWLGLFQAALSRYRGNCWPWIELLSGSGRRDSWIWLSYSPLNEADAWKTQGRLSLFSNRVPDGVQKLLSNKADEICPDMLMMRTDCLRHRSTLKMVETSAVLLQINQSKFIIVWALWQLQWVQMFSFAFERTSLFRCAKLKIGDARRWWSEMHPLPVVPKF